MLTLERQLYEEEALTFLWHAVAAPLSAHVRFLYQWEGPVPHEREAIYPLPFMDLKFSFGDPLRVYEPGGDAPAALCDGSWCIGIRNHRHIVEYPANARFVGVSFRPGGALAFLRTPLSELHNRIVPLADIWGPAVAALSEQLYEARSAGERFALAEAILLDRLGDASSPSPVVGHVAEQIGRRHGAVRIGALCSEVGISRKHLIDLFKREVGCTPKELARLHRFAHVLQSIDPAAPSDWTSLAYENNYFDQAHFSHDFADYTGLNPSAYLQVLRGIPAQGFDHAAALGVSPAG